MFNYLPRKLITAVLAATLSLGAGLAATTAEAHPHGIHGYYSPHVHYGHHSHYVPWRHGYFRGSFAYPQNRCYTMVERVRDPHHPHRIRHHYVKVCF